MPKDKIPINLDIKYTVDENQKMSKYYTYKSQDYTCISQNYICKSQDYTCKSQN